MTYLFSMFNKNNLCAIVAKYWLKSEIDNTISVFLNTSLSIIAEATHMKAETAKLT